jgi:uncharacterized lipoprotein YddW (UPF0748 family)
MRPRIIAGLFGSVLVAAAGAQIPPAAPEGAPPVPPKSRFETQAPLPGLPSVVLDMLGDGYGEAQLMARAKGLQARILWIDGTANISRINTYEKVAALVDRARYAGFNTIVLDVKPIIGYTLWPSKIAPKLTEWRGQSFGDFDPVAAMVAEAKKCDIPLFVSLNAFSEGHRDLEKGPGYDRPEWQTVLYELDGSVRSAGYDKAAFGLMNRTNLMPSSEEVLGVFTDIARLPAKLNGNSKVSVVDESGNVLAQADGASARSLAINVPVGGSALVGIGRGGEYLRVYGKPDDRFTFEGKPEFVPISRRPWQQVPLMVNPNDSTVRRRELSILRELLENYDVAGVLYDDRLRYAGLNADFSEVTRQQFEKYVGEKIAWPEDVFRWTLMPDLSRGIVPGKWYDAWLAFRAETLKSFVSEARAVMREVRPNALMGAYSGSWYGEYAAFGSNYAASEFEAGFRFLTPAYQKAGFADELDILITGCYYPTATIAEAMAQGTAVGYTVEAAGQLSNRVARDQAWVYAGISLEVFKGDTAKLRNALQAAVASTQGVMVFDLSHDMDKLWHIFMQAFSVKTKAPHQAAGLLAEIRHRRKLLDRSGAKEPPVIINTGSGGAGL